MGFDIFTDYYYMEKLPNTRSKLRLDCTASTAGYLPFERLAARGRDKRFKFYYGVVPSRFRVEAARRAGAAITDTVPITSVYMPDVRYPHLGYGDMYGTNDALLFVFGADYTTVEIFVARGHKWNALNIYLRAADGTLTAEMERIRTQAVPMRETADTRQL